MFPSSIHISNKEEYFKDICINYLVTYLSEHTQKMMSNETTFHTQFINFLSIQFLIWDSLLSLMVNTIYSEVPNRNLKVMYSPCLHWFQPLVKSFIFQFLKSLKSTSIIAKFVISLVCAFITPHLNYYLAFYKVYPPQSCIKNFDKNLDGS